MRYCFTILKDNKYITAMIVREFTSSFSIFSHSYEEIVPCLCKDDGGRGQDSYLSR